MNTHSAAGSRWTHGVIFAAALVLTGINVAKPLVMDDAAYFYYAKQIAQSPADPYGFEVFWYQEPRPAHQVLAPPVVPYWWAGAMAVGGEQPGWWKLWLFPFALVLCWALRELLSRFAPGFETPLLWMIVLSPAVVPAFNLMLDVPALALACAGLAVFARSCDSNSSTLALTGGVIAGLAVQTKYPASVTVAMLPVYALIFGRLRLGVLAAVAAAVVFGGWELFVASRYGESHFLYHAVRRVAGPGGQGPGVWAVGGLALLGALAPFAGVLGLAAMGVARRLVATAVVAVGLWFAVLPWFPVSTVGRWRGYPDLAAPHPTLFGFALLGLGTASVLGFAWMRAPAFTRSGSEASKLDTFLWAWLAMAIVGFFALSPFLATRHAIVVVVVIHLVLARTAWHESSRDVQATRAGAARSIRRRGSLGLAVGSGIALGMLFAVSDTLDALRWQCATRSVAEHIERSAKGTLPAPETWYIGHWGFQFEAERLGMRPVIPDRSLLRRGDYLVLPQRIHAQRIEVETNLGARIARVEEPGTWPWSTLPSAYLSHLPIRARGESPAVVDIYRVVRSFVAKSRPLGSSE